MLFKKKSIEPPLDTPAPINIHVDTIPHDFYAGANPVIKFKNFEQEIDVKKTNSLLSPADKTAFEKASVPGVNQSLHPASVLSKHHSLFFIIGGLFLLLVAGGSVYVFVLRPSKSSVVVVPTPIVDTSTVAVVTTTPVEAVPTSTPDAIIPTTTIPVSLKDVPLDFPSTLLGDSADNDNDSLSDKEEEVFKTDPGVPDSDSDKYTDGHEVYNLYNPSGVTPMKIADSGLVKEFVNPNFGYKVYYPVSWIEDNVDNEYRQVLFSTVSGENIEIRTFNRENDDIDFPAWFSKWGKDQKFDDLVSFETGFKFPGFRRQDFLTYYFMDDAHVYVILYHPAQNENIIHYRTVLKLIARSFHFGNSTVNTVNLPIENSLGNNTATSSATSSNGIVTSSSSVTTDVEFATSSEFESSSSSTSIIPQNSTSTASATTTL